MKRLKYGVVMTLVAACTIGCNKQEINDQQPPVRKGKITLHASIAPETALSRRTRAPQLDETGKGAFSDGDVFTLQAAPQSHPEAATAISYTVGNTDLYWSDIHTDSDKSSVDFAACWPEQKLENGGFLFDLNATSSRDLLWAFADNVPVGTEEPVELIFGHAMHYLVINYTLDAALAADEVTTECTAKSTCRVNLADRTLDNSDSPKATFSATGNNVAFWLIPQKTADVQLNITAGGTTKEFDLSSIVTGSDYLESGKRLTVNLKVKNGSIVIEGNTIMGWEDQGSVEGEIIM